MEVEFDVPFDTNAEELIQMNCRRKPALPLAEFECPSTPTMLELPTIIRQPDPPPLDFVAAIPVDEVE